MYLWLKAFHLTAVLIFAAGLMLLAVVTSVWSPAAGVVLPHERRLGQVVLRWDRLVTLPAMLLAWSLGLTLVFLGGWMGQAWLTGKIVFVVVLSGLHGTLSGTLRRRMSTDSIRAPVWSSYMPVLTAVGLASVALLVTLKP